MQQDELFPLADIPPRVRRAILREFQGRWPTVQEIAQISDRHWLATPDIGPSSLEKIHSIIQVHRSQTDPFPPPQLINNELLDRLEFIQEEFRWLERAVKAKLHRRRRSEASFGRGSDRASAPNDGLSLG
ncbi:hypothetical protein JH26_01210 [Microvirga sp. BSC39]|nr:hypothetical protein JH26_01210 [Microvirga sp. BSC39]